MKLSAILEKFEAVTYTGGGTYRVRCSMPEHADSDPSADLTLKDTGRIDGYCHGCHANGAALFIAAGLADHNLFDVDNDSGNVVTASSSANARPVDFVALAEFVENCASNLAVAEAFIKERYGLTLGQAEKLGLGVFDGSWNDTPDPFKNMWDKERRPRLIIPFRDPDGKLVGMQGRMIVPCEEKHRWRTVSGTDSSKLAAFGWEEFGDRTVIICEGPSDALAAVGANCPALAIRGAGIMKNPKILEQLKAWLDGRKAIIIGDRDDNEVGDKASKYLSEKTGIPCWTLPEGSGDLAEYLMAGGSLREVVGQGSVAVEERELLRRRIVADIELAAYDEDLLGDLKAFGVPQVKTLCASISRTGVPGFRQGNLDDFLDALKAAVRAHGGGDDGEAGRGGGDQDLGRGGAGEGGDQRPSIIIDGHTQTRDLRGQLTAALITDNERSRRIFHGATGEVVQFTPGGPFGTPALVKIIDTQMYSLCADVADWFEERGDNLVAIHPDKDIAKMVLNSIEPIFPHINRLLNVPTLLPNGLLTEPWKFYEEFGFIFAPDKGLVGLDIPTGDVSADDVVEAVEFLLDQLKTFPFDSHAARIHALVFGLTPYYRDLVEGPVPGWLVEAPSPRTGKGKLINTMLLDLGAIGTGAGDRPEDEIRKSLTSLLVEGKPVIFLDNFNSKIQGGPLAAMMTAEGLWSDRQLQYTKQLSLEIKAVFAFAANNPKTSGELAGRLVPSRMDAKCERPENLHFDDSDVQPARARKDRIKIIRAKLVILKWWAQQGMQHGEHLPFGSFEMWSGVSAGVLDSLVKAFDEAGLANKVYAYVGDPYTISELCASFLANREALKEASDFELTQMKALVSSWAEVHDTKRVRASDILELLKANKDIIIDLETDGSPSPRKRLFALVGLLNTMNNNIYGGWKVYTEQSGKDTFYRLTWVDVVEE